MSRMWFATFISGKTLNLHLFQRLLWSLFQWYILHFSFILKMTFLVYFHYTVEHGMELSMHEWCRSSPPSCSVSPLVNWSTTIYPSNCNFLPMKQKVSIEVKCLWGCVWGGMHTRIDALYVVAAIAKLLLFR